MAKRREPLKRLLPYLTLFSALAIMGLLFWAKEVFVPIALAILFSFLLSPLCDWMERMRVNRVVSVLSTAFIAFAILASVLVYIGSEFQKLSQELPRYQDEFMAKVETVSSINERMGGRLQDIVNRVTKNIAQQTAQAAKKVAQQSAPNATAGETPVTNTFQRLGETPQKPIYTRVVEEQQNPLTRVASSLSVVLGPLGVAGLVVVFTLFLLIYRDDLRDRLVYLISTNGNYVVTTDAIADASDRVSRYIVAQSLLNASYGAILGAGLFCIGYFFGQEHGFPNFFLWAFIAALFRFVPYAGPVIGSFFPLAIALVTFEGYSVFISTFILIIVIELISNNVVEPWVYGSSTGLSSVAIIVAAVFWGWLWGPVGLLLSTPLTVCLVSFGRYLPQLKIFSILLGDEQAMPLTVRFYQRLLNQDLLKAQWLLDAEVKSRGLLEVGDKVLLPAVRKIHRDFESEHFNNQSKVEYTKLIQKLIDEMICTADERWEKLDRQARKILEESQQLNEGKDKAVALMEDADAVPTSLPNSSAATDAIKTAQEIPETGSAELPDERPRICCIAAHDEMEQHLMRLFTDMQVQQELEIHIESSRRLPKDIVKQLNEQDAAAAVIGVIPPGGLLQAEYLCGLIRESNEDIPIIVAYFSKPRNFDKLLVRLRKSGCSYLTTSLQQTLKQIKTVVESSDSVQDEPTMKLETITSV